MLAEADCFVLLILAAIPFFVVSLFNDTTDEPEQSGQLPNTYFATRDET